MTMVVFLEMWVDHYLTTTVVISHPDKYQVLIPQNHQLKYHLPELTGVLKLHCKH